MPDYRVRWEIDIEAESPRAAALQALHVQRDHDDENTATVFEVSRRAHIDTDTGEPIIAGAWVTVDLDEPIGHDPDCKGAIADGLCDGCGLRWDCC